MIKNCKNTSIKQTERTAFPYDSHNFCTSTKSHQIIAHTLEFDHRIDRMQANQLSGDVSSTLIVDLCVLSIVCPSVIVVEPECDCSSTYIAVPSPIKRNIRSQ